MEIIYRVVAEHPYPTQNDHRERHILVDKHVQCRRNSKFIKIMSKGTNLVVFRNFILDCHEELELLQLNNESWNKFTSIGDVSS